MLGSAQPLSHPTPHTKALLLLGHGSHYSADSSAPVRMHAETLLRRKLFDEVLVAFWKEEPNICHALDLLQSKDIFIVPFFISNGYFTEQVLPRELGIKDPITIQGHHRIFYGQPVGTHPSMSHTLLHCAQKAVQQNGSLNPKPQESTLIIVGHGTTKNEHSAEAVYQQVELLRQQKQFYQVLPAFMEQPPYDKDVLDQVETPYAIVVPFFISDGLHSREDIPINMGFAKKHQTWENPILLQQQQKSFHLWYAKAIGLEPSMTDVILDRVRELQNLTQEDASGSAWIEKMNRAPITNPYTFTFIEEILAAGEIQFGELLLNAQKATFSIRHIADRDLPIEKLKELTNPADADDLSQTTVKGDYRSLRSAPTLQRGWFFHNLSREDLLQILDRLLPAVVMHRAMWRNGTLKVRSFEEVANRQSGIYTVIRHLKTNRIQSIANQCCNEKGCVKHPLWSIHQHELQPVIRKPYSIDPFVIPCSEPCSWMIEMARRNFISEE